MEVDGTAIKEISKLLKTPYILITFALASGLILFLPDDIINKMYMLDFRNKFGFVLGLTFWFSITLLIVTLGVKVYKRYEHKRLNKKVQEGMKRFLLNMKNKAEIEVITQMLKEDDYTLELLCLDLSYLSRIINLIEILIYLIDPFLFIFFDLLYL